MLPGRCEDALQLAVRCGLACDPKDDCRPESAAAQETGQNCQEDDPQLRPRLLLHPVPAVVPNRAEDSAVGGLANPREPRWAATEAATRVQAVCAFASRALRPQVCRTALDHAGRAPSRAAEFQLLWLLRRRVFPARVLAFPGHRPLPAMALRVAPDSSTRLPALASAPAW